MAGTCGSVTGGMVVLTSSCSSQNTQNWQELAKDQVLFYSRMKKSRKRTDYRKTSKPHDFNVRMAADQTNMDSRLIQAVIQISDKNSLSVGKVPGEKYGSSHQIGTPK